MGSRAEEAFKELQPEMASVLEGASLHGVEWVEARDGAPNIRVDNGPPLHSQYSPFREAKEIVQGLNMASVELVYWYGLGLGYAYSALKEWLEEAPNHYVVFLEDDIRVLKAFLSREEANEVVDNPQVALFYWDRQKEDLKLFAKELASHYLGLRFAITSLPSYGRGKAAVYQQLQVTLRHRSALVHFAGTEFVNHGVSFYKSFYHNLLQLPGCYAFSGLEGRFQGVPAIICGAGPSLNKNGERLRALQDKALLMAGGSAINALGERGILPHFAASVDPNTEQYERMSRQSVYEVPFLFKTRIQYQAFQCLQGPKVYVCGNNGYPISDWVEERLGLTGSQPSEGFNVLHLLMDVARRLGCDPIIFVGMDLAYTDLQLYAQDVVKETHADEKALTSGEDPNFNAFKRPDIFGDEVYTLWKWVGESDYTGGYAQEHPEVRFVNATEGGIGMPGVPNLSLEEVERRYLKRSWDLRGLVHQELQAYCRTDFSLEQVVEVVDELFLSLKACERLTAAVEEGFLEILKGVRQDNPGRMKRGSEKVQEAQGELNQELAYGRILEPVHQFRALVFERLWREIEHDRRIQSDKERMERRLEAQIREVQILRESTGVNLILMQESLKRARTEGIEVPELGEREVRL